MHHKRELKDMLLLLVQQQKKQEMRLIRLLSSFFSWSRARRNNTVVLRISYRLAKNSPSFALSHDADGTTSSGVLSSRCCMPNRPNVILTATPAPASMGREEDETTGQGDI